MGSQFNPHAELTERLERIEQLLLSGQMSKSFAPETLNLVEASKLCHISKSRMYDLARKKKIPCTRIGSRYIFIRIDLINWFRTNSNNWV
jgi:predicted DNA-binding transcriptional regulator AlpA